MLEIKNGEIFYRPTSVKRIKSYRRRNATTRRLNRVIPVGRVEVKKTLPRWLTIRARSGYKRRPTSICKRLIRSLTKQYYA